MWKTQNIANNEKVEVDTEQQYNYLTTRIMFINIKLTNFKAIVKKNKFKAKTERSTCTKGWRTLCITEFEHEE